MVVDLPRVCTKLVCFCCKFISLRLDGNLERNDNSGNRNEMWKTHNCHLILKDSKTEKCQLCYQCSPRSTKNSIVLDWCSFIRWHLNTVPKIGISIYLKSFGKFSIIAVPQCAFILSLFAEVLQAFSKGFTSHVRYIRSEWGLQLRLRKSNLSPKQSIESFLLCFGCFRVEEQIWCFNVQFDIFWNMFGIIALCTIGNTNWCSIFAVAISQYHCHCHTYAQAVADTGRFGGGMRCRFAIQCFTGPYCVIQSLPHTYIYEETSLSLV